MNESVMPIREHGTYGADVGDLARELKVTRSLIYGFTRRIGKDPDAIPALKVGKFWRFSIPEVVAWFRRRTPRGK